MAVTVVLVRPKIPGNIGAIARVMANFGFEKLILLNPKASHLSEESKERARHAKYILEDLEVIETWEELKTRFDLLVGTTGKRASKYNLRRLTVSPEKLAERIGALDKEVGLVFGGERVGLMNEEIDECDFLVSIKTSEEYPVMNLSHAVAVVLHEVHNYDKGPVYEPAGREVREAILDWIDKVLKHVEVEREAPIKSTFKRLLSRGMVKEREAFTLAGFFRNVYNKIKKK